MRRSLAASMALLVPAALAGCALGPRYAGPPTVAASPAWTEPASTAPVSERWWEALNDPTLNGLVEATLAHNLDLAAAEARLREARANRGAAAAARLPQVNASASANRNELSDNGLLPAGRIPGISRRYDLFDLGFDASWEVDLWGRVARSVDAADARAASTLESQRDVQVQVIAEVVRTYGDLRTAQARLASETADAKARAQTAALTDLKARGGEAARLDADRAESQARATAAGLPGVKADLRAAAYSLATLTGRPPEAMLALAETPAAPPAPPPEVGAGLRADLLRRRPDVREAERDLAAATADVAVARGDLFPKITLAAQVGRQAQNANDLGSDLSTRYVFGPSLSWPIFAAGRIRAQIRAAGARTDAAAARYEKAVLSALADSETALNRYAAAKEEQNERDSSLARSADALELAQLRYRAGEDDLLTLLQAQSDFSAAEDAAVRTKGAQLTALASLYKALGGGWQAPALPVVPSSSKAATEVGSNTETRE